MTDPLVNLPAQGFLGGMVIIAQQRAGQCALERREGRADDPDTPVVRPFDQLPVAGDQRFQGGRCGIPGESGTGPGNVVDAEHHHHAACAWLGQYVAVQTCQRARAHAVAQQTGAGNPRIDHGDAMRDQAFGEEVRPTAVPVEAGAGSVGDRVAERHQRPRCRFGFDQDTCQQQARAGALAVRRVQLQCVALGLLAGDDPARLAAVPVEGFHGRGGRQVETHQHLRERGHRHRHRIAE